MNLELVKVALATWYVAYALTQTHGPFRLFIWMRHNLPHGGLLTCPVCLAFWAALALLLAPPGLAVDALAVAGLAMLAHSWTGWRFGA